MDLLGGLGSLIGSWISSSAQKDIAQQNIANQQDLAAHGLGYRIQDAVAHGLSPLVGAGVQPASFSPVSLGDSNWSESFSKMGQGLERAMKANSDDETRKAIDEASARRLDLENKGLQNDLLRTQIAGSVMRTGAASSQLGPAIPGNWRDFAEGRRAPDRSPEGVALDPDKIKSKADSAPGTRQLNLWGIGNMPTNPNRASAQDLQNEYGDIMGDVLAAPNFLSDAIYGARGYLRNFDGRYTKAIIEGLRGGDRSRWSKAQRNMRGGDFR